MMRRRNIGLVYPSIPDNVLRFAKSMEIETIRVVIVGQCPARNDNATGIAFSASQNAPAHYSTRWIIKELIRDLSVSVRWEDCCRIGNLETWVDQGVLLFNALLTSTVGEERGTDINGRMARFTDYVIRVLSQREDPIIFLLWGNMARSKKNLIDVSRHRVLEAAHPGYRRRTFQGCGHFSKCNEWLESNNRDLINWFQPWNHLVNEA